MSDLKDWLARDVLIVAELSGACVIICESAESLHEVQGEEMTFSVDESLASENTRLRELVRGLDHCMRSTSSSSDECAGCPLQGWGVSGFRCTKSDRMRELGIEVTS